MNNYGAVATTSQADGQEADVHLTRSLNQQLDRSGSTMRIAVWHHTGDIDRVRRRHRIKAGDVATSITYLKSATDQQRARPTAVEEDGDEATHPYQHMVFTQAGTD
jgi:hypothetical protein